MTIAEGTVVWQPTSTRIAESTLHSFTTYLEGKYDTSFGTYATLHDWSVTKLDDFWEAVWDYFDVWSATPHEGTLVDRGMPDVEWFPGATLNYAEQALRRTGDLPAVIARSQSRGDFEWSWDELRSQVARVRAGLVRLGVRRGDRVVAYLPNIPEAVAAYLATASLGAVWSSCAPEFGVRSVVDRFRQISPKVLLVITGYRYGQKIVDRSREVAELRDALPSVEHTVHLPYLDGSDVPPDSMSWDQFTEVEDDLGFEPLPFDHPLVVLFSSGTTGLPKAIVHGHGGIMMEHLKLLALQYDIQEKDRFFWYSSTGWMMWNVLVSGLSVGAGIVTYDGSPAYPDIGGLWQIAEETGTTFLGLSAGYILGCRREGLVPGRDFDLSKLWGIGSTASPLPTEGYAWIYECVSPSVQLVAGSGGTDVATGFVGGAPTVPVYAGEMSCAALGVDVASYDPQGRACIGQQGELVVRNPMPSMPVCLWGDDDGSRLREAYFSFYPGVWRHGDWLRITDRGTHVISGRSDATLNRGGIRLGTGEFYSVVEGVQGVRDSLVVHLDGGPDDPAGQLILYVALDRGSVLDGSLRERIVRQLRSELSPRHAPDEVVQVTEIPYTLSGKKLEVPVKRILQGEARDDVIADGAVANPEVLDQFCPAAS